MGCMLFWVKFGHAFAARPDCALYFPAGKRKYIFTQESFYLQGIFDDINEQDKSDF